MTLTSVSIFLLLMFLAALSFLFSSSETSIISLNRIKLRHMMLRGVKRAKHVQNLITNLDKFIVAILVGNNLVNISISAIITAIAVSIFGKGWGVVVATFVTTFFILIVCEITPKILATKHTERIALITAPAMEAFIKIFHPIFAIFHAASNLILKILNIKSPKKASLITEEELRLMIEIGKEEGVVTADEREMLHRIFEFGDTKVEDVMVPKEEIVAVSIDASVEKLMDIFSEQGHARLPVYRNSIDNIEGVIFTRDLLYMLRDKQLFVLADLMRPIYYVPSTTQVNTLLKKFQVDKIQIAVVVDENKKVLGLVTLEDLVEEIVGEIHEETRKN
ncbi:MAG: hemolysin family protein [Candidatus Omnitrophota bacterium]